MGTLSSNKKVDGEARDLWFLNTKAREKCKEFPDADAFSRTVLQIRGKPSVKGLGTQYSKNNLHSNTCDQFRTT